MRLRIIKLEAQLRDMGSELDTTQERVLRMKGGDGSGATSSDERLKRAVPGKGGMSRDTS